MVNGLGWIDDKSKMRDKYHCLQFDLITAVKPVMFKIPMKVLSDNSGFGLSHFTKENTYNLNHDHHPNFHCHQHRIGQLNLLFEIRLLWVRLIKL